MSNDKRLKSAMHLSNDKRLKSAMDLLIKIKDGNISTYEKFADLMRRFKRNEITLDTISDKVYKLIGTNPDLWSKFVAFLPEHQTEKLKSKESRLIPPINVSTDTFGAIVKLLPLPSLARLSETCMWANVQITPAVFDAALQRARLTQGIFSVSESLRIKNANDETILVRPVAEGLSSLRVQISHRRYVAEVDDAGMASLLADIMASDEETRGRTRIWFRFDSHSDSEVVYIELFVSQDGEIVQQASAACILA